MCVVCFFLLFLISMSITANKLLCCTHAITHEIVRVIHFHVRGVPALILIVLKYIFSSPSENDVNIFICFFSLSICHLFEK